MKALKTKILTIEDDVNMADMIGSLLEESGYEVVHFFDANGALEWLKTHKPELIISDIGLPGISGVQFCEIVKNDPSTASLPVIMLTSFGDETHKVQSLRTGADDYVVKPFSNNELLARVEALLRRCHHKGRMDKLLASGPLKLNVDTGEVFADGRGIILLPKEFALLAMFLGRKGRILDYSFIAEAVWGLDSIVMRDTIKVTIHRLKVKLGSCAGCIESVPGLGYKWVESREDTAHT